MSSYDGTNPGKDDFAIPITLAFLSALFFLLSLNVVPAIKDAMKPYKIMFNGDEISVKSFNGLPTFLYSSLTAVYLTEDEGRKLRTLRFREENKEVVNVDVERWHDVQRLQFLLETELIEVPSIYEPVVRSKMYLKFKSFYLAYRKNFSIIMRFPDWIVALSSLLLPLLYFYIAAQFSPELFFFLILVGFFLYALTLMLISMAHQIERNNPSLTADASDEIISRQID
ncbi:MAG: hypothetical protein ACRBF0_21195 [Calditrichia bacterium]